MISLLPVRRAISIAQCAPLISSTRLRNTSGASAGTLGLKCRFSVSAKLWMPATPAARRPSSSATTGSRPSTPGWITNRQIEAARIAMTRKIKRGGKGLLDQCFPRQELHEEAGRDAHGLLGQGLAGGSSMRRLQL